MNARSINLTVEAKPILHDYLIYLRSQENYETGPEAPLFPGYPDTRKFDKDMNVFAPGLNFSDLRRAGVQRYYKLRRRQGLIEKDALKAAAEQFRMTDQVVKKLVKETVESPGYRQPGPNLSDAEKLLVYFDAILGLQSVTVAERLKEDFLRFIDGSSFQPGEKENFRNQFLRDLQARLEQIPKEAEERELQRTRKIKDLSEVVKEFSPPEEKEGKEKPELSDLEKYYFGEGDGKEE